MVIIITILVYFCVLLLFSHITARRASSNETFYRANRRSPWYMVAFGMVGASISGITFVSVPGMVMKTDMTYLQMCLGFIVGYFLVGFLLLPIYYRYNLTTIYSYLQQRLGERSYKTGASFFLLSKMTGAAVRFFVVCILLQRFVLDGVGVPFWVTVPVMVMLIWLYTRKGGIKTLVWTDSFQTTCMFAALILIIYQVMAALGMTPSEAVSAIVQDSHSRIFVFDDWVSKQNFWKQFLSGVFVVIVMTGLDQDMMQKNLTCRTLREAQKDMCTYGLAFLPVNALFLGLGILLYTLCAAQQLTPPTVGDQLLPWLVSSGTLGSWVIIPFTIGIVAAAFSSADSAMTALTTTICIDLLGMDESCEAGSRAVATRRCVHLVVALLFMLCIISFRVIGNDNVLNSIYVMASYTYGPLLGLYTFGLFTHRAVNDRLAPYICLAAPIVCGLLDHYAPLLWGYTFGYELLLLNGLLTMLGLALVQRNR